MGLLDLWNSLNLDQSESIQKQAVPVRCSSLKVYGDDRRCTERVPDTHVISASVRVVIHFAIMRGGFCKTSGLAYRCCKQASERAQMSSLSWDAIMPRRIFLWDAYTIDAGRFRCYIASSYKFQMSLILQVSGEWNGDNSEITHEVRDEELARLQLHEKKSNPTVATLKCLALCYGNSSIDQLI